MWVCLLLLICIRFLCFSVVNVLCMEGCFILKKVINLCLDGSCFFLLNL